MTSYSIDITYAYAQLGLAAGAPLEEIGEVLTHARAYQFATNERIRNVERFVEFFIARDKLGDINTPFAFIRRAYHKKAMMLHPDRNSGNKAAEEQLKTINNAFAIVDAIHREARDYYRQNETMREVIEDEARDTTERETPPEIRAQRKARAEQANRKQQTEDIHQPSETVGTGKYEKPRDTPLQQEALYVAASIPRFIRTAKLGHIPIDCIIGSWHVVQRDNTNYIYDIVMLPEREFTRARILLATPNLNPALQRGAFTPTYIPKDIKSVTVPPGELYPERYAKEYFLKEFKIKNGV